MHLTKEKLHSTKNYAKSFFKWLAAGLILGAAGGFLGTLFNVLVELSTQLRQEDQRIIWLLPLGGMVIVLLYKLSGVSLDTNLVFKAARGEGSINPLMAPLMLTSSVISHLFGASVGRVGASLQMGGTLGYIYGKSLGMGKKDRHVLIMSGMSAVFATIFGTPVTAIFFALEVTSVGNIYYVGLWPCLISSLTAWVTGKNFGVKNWRFVLEQAPEMGLAGAMQALVIGIVCALLSILFCVALHGCERKLKSIIKNDYARIAAGGLAVAGLTFIVGTGAYNGAGTEIIHAAVEKGQAEPLAFAVKMLFTVISVSCGFKGGEIAPTLFIGASLGCVLGEAMGMAPGFAAALCMVGLFCGMVNSPISSILFSVELFGGEYLPYFVIVCAVSYMLSGNYSLYHAQRIQYAKTFADYIDDD